MHIHSARNGNKLSNTLKYSYLSGKIVKHMECVFDAKINRKSLDYARFLSHIRFTIERVLTNTILDNDLIDVIKKSYEVAEDAAKIIEESLDKKVIEDEIAYIAMHVERFRIALNEKNS